MFCDSIKGSGLPLDVLKLFSVQDTAQPFRGRTVRSCNTNLSRINGKPIQCKAFICWPYPFLLPDLCQVSSEPFRTFSKGLECPECKQTERVWWGIGCIKTASTELSTAIRKYLTLKLNGMGHNTGFCF